jgi:hypothetical protein
VWVWPDDLAPTLLEPSLPAVRGPVSPAVAAAMKERVPHTQLTSISVAVGEADPYGLDLGTD